MFMLVKRIFKSENNFSKHSWVQIVNGSLKPSVLPVACFSLIELLYGEY